MRQPCCQVYAAAIIADAVADMIYACFDAMLIRQMPLRCRIILMLLPDNCEQPVKKVYMRQE